MPKVKVLSTGEETKEVVSGNPANEEWEEYKKSWTEVIAILGGVIFLPLIIFVSVLYGTRAGMIEGTDKFLYLLKKNWGNIK